MITRYVELTDKSQLRKGDVCRVWSEDGSEAKCAGEISNNPNGNCFKIRYKGYGAGGNGERSYSPEYLVDVSAMRKDRDKGETLVLVGSRVKKRLENLFGLMVPGVLECGDGVGDELEEG